MPDSTPVSVSVISIGEVRTLVVICSDGSVWRLVDDAWQQGPPVPGTRADRQPGKAMGWVLTE
jgi:hypothetical protein